MPRIRGRAGALLAALALILTLGALHAIPATASTFTEQCDQSGQCLNMWGGGNDVRSWHGTTANNYISVQWISGSTFELRDNVSGGCIGALNGTPGDARAGGNQECPSSGHAGWSTVFRPDYTVCPSGWAGYVNVHWGGYVNIPIGNGYQVFLNAPVDCLRQF